MIFIIRHNSNVTVPKLDSKQTASDLIKLMVQYFDIYWRNTPQVNLVTSGHIHQVCVAVKVWIIWEVNASIC